MSNDTLKEAIESHRRGELDSAERLYRLVLTQNPNEAEAHHKLGILERERLSPQASLAHFAAAISAAPAQGEYWISYAEALLAAGRLSEAWNTLVRAIRHGLSGAAVATLLERIQPVLGPDQGELSLQDACFRFRTALLATSQIDATRDRVRHEISRCGKEGSREHARALIDAAEVLRQVEDEELAWESMAAAASLDGAAWEPRLIGSRLVPRVCTSAQESNLWYERLTRGIDSLARMPEPQTRAEAEQVQQGLLRTTNFQLAYYGHDERERQAAFGQFACRTMATLFPFCAVPQSRTPRASRLGDQRIRIGYASSYFHSHTIMLLFNGWTWPLDRSRFKLHLYALGGPSDASAAELARGVEVFRDLRDCRERCEAAVTAICADELDILVYPELGMDGFAFCLAALRLAPTQCAAWGHPITTGLPTIDFFLSSDLMEPEDGDSHYSETLVRLPGTSLYYKRPTVEECRSLSELGLPPDGVLYLCCQAVQKYRPEFDYIFPAIASRVTDARFVFVLQPRHLYANRIFRLRLQRAFDAAGLDAARHLVFLEWLPWNDFLALNGACDVFLDSIGWSGGNTCLEALAHGLPVITLPGPLMRSRHSYAFLRALGVEDGIACDPQDFIEKATALGTKPDLRQAISARIRAAHDRLFGDRSVIDALQQFYERCVP